MATYVYEDATLGKGRCIAKYEDYFVYDMRESLYEPCMIPTGVIKGNYLYDYRKLQATITRIYVKGDTAYISEGALEYKTPYLTAKNGVIYTYSGNSIYDKSQSLALYTGDATEALFAYAALAECGWDTTSEDYYNDTHNTKPSEKNKSTDSSSSATGGIASTIGAVLGFGGIFLLVAIGMSINRFYSYLCLLDVILPLILLVIVLIFKYSSNVEYEYTLLKSIGGFLQGAFYGFVIKFFSTPLSMIVDEYFANGRTQIVENSDFTVFPMFIIFGIIGIILSGESTD